MAVSRGQAKREAYLKSDEFIEAREKSEGRYISFRVSGKDADIIEALIGLWGENQSQTIKRALQIAYDLELQLQEQKNDK